MPTGNNGPDDSGLYGIQVVWNHCPYCGQKAGSPDWKARTHILWANQHGTQQRIFCDCGTWADYTWSNKRGEIVSHRIVKKPLFGNDCQHKYAHREEEGRFTYCPDCGMQWEDEPDDLINWPF